LAPSRLDIIRSSCCRRSSTIFGSSWAWPQGEPACYGTWPSNTRWACSSSGLCLLKKRLLLVIGVGLSRTASIRQRLPNDFSHEWPRGTSALLSRSIAGTLAGEQASNSGECILGLQVGWMVEVEGFWFGRFLSATDYVLVRWMLWWSCPVVASPAYARNATPKCLCQSGADNGFCERRCRSATAKTVWGH
jgi:hypothetical protein